MGMFSYDWSGFTGACNTKDPARGLDQQHYCCPASGLTPSKPDVCASAKYVFIVVLIVALSVTALTPSFHTCSKLLNASISMSYLLTSMLLFLFVCFRYLKEVTDVELWAEGVNGTFHIEVSSITIMTGSSWM